MSIKEESYSDRVFEVDAFCNLDCGLEGGQCFMERQTETGDIKKRCLCPAGKTGHGCSTGKYYFQIKPGVNFINVLCADFTFTDPKKHTKKTDNLNFLRVWDLCT